MVDRKHKMLEVCQYSAHNFILLLCLSVANRNTNNTKPKSIFASSIAYYSQVTRKISAF